MKRLIRTKGGETPPDADHAFRETIEAQRHGSEPHPMSPMWKRTPEVLLIIAIVLLAWANAGYVLSTIT